MSKDYPDDHDHDGNNELYGGHGSYMTDISALAMWDKTDKNVPTPFCTGCL